MPLRNGAAPVIARAHGISTRPGGAGSAWWCGAHPPGPHEPPGPGTARKGPRRVPLRNVAAAAEGRAAPLALLLGHADASPAAADADRTPAHAAAGLRPFFSYLWLGVVHFFLFGACGVSKSSFYEREGSTKVKMISERCQQKYG